MKRLVYKVIDNLEVLISEEVFNKSEMLIFAKDFEVDPPREKKFKYGEGNRLVLETEFENDKELSRLEFSYDETGEAVESKLTIDNEVVENTLTEYSDDGYTKTTFQKGVEVEKYITSEEGDTYVNQFFENKELIEKHVGIYNSVKRIEETKMFDENEILIGTRIEIYDANDFLIQSKELDAKNNLMIESQFTIENGVIKSEINKDFTDGEFEEKVTYEYDANQNCVKKENHSLSGNLLSFHHMKYDDQNRIVEESGLSQGSFNAVFGTSTDANKFHFIYKYEA